MSDLEWRSAAAQTFVGGQITQIDSYWQSSVLGANIYELIEEYDLWSDAFGGSGSKIKDKWKSMLALRTGQGSIGRVAKARFGNLRGKSEVKLGTDLFQALKQDVVMHMHQMFNRSSLTINFKADGWFKDQAGWDSYTTMWDRKTSGTALSTNPDPQNPAHIRAKADRWALYGQFSEWQTARGRVWHAASPCQETGQSHGSTVLGLFDRQTGNPPGAPLFGQPQRQPDLCCAQLWSEEVRRQYPLWSELF